MIDPVWIGSTTNVPYSVLRLENVIYKFTSPSGKSYVGKTKNLYKRFSNYKNSHGHCLGSAIRRSILKYGFENFEFSVLAKFKTCALLEAAEIIAIWGEKTKAPNGYNLTIGGDGVSNPTEETRAKMSKARSGKKSSTETRAKISKAHIGKKITQEVRERLLSYALGHKPSDETLQKRSDSVRKNKMPDGTDIPMYIHLKRHKSCETGVFVNKPGYRVKSFLSKSPLTDRIELAKKYLESL